MTRVLVLHSRYLSGDASGENRVVEDEARLLREGGHQVHTWTPSIRATSGLGLVRAAGSVVWSRHAAAQVDGLISRFRPDVVHCHNLFPSLSPSILRVACRRVPTVMTLHNYRLFCLPATLQRDDRVCEDCLGRRLLWPGVVHACYRGSTAASAALATSLSLHRAIGTFAEVSIYLAVSRFLMDKHVQAGVPASRIRIKPNFAWAMPRRQGPGDYFLYLGRLSREKGVDTLLSVWKEPQGRLVVVGDGPDGPRLRAMAPPDVEFRGAVPPAEVAEVLRRARALLVPSKWYEGEPRAVLEAYASGVPVIVSDIGGLPHLVEHDASGLVVPPRDERAWARAIERLQDDAEAERMGEGAWRAWSDRYSPEKALRELEAVYEDAMRRGTAGSARFAGFGVA
jgi:glycosyltransferase involved in cell wall biosynthesis